MKVAYFEPAIDRETQKEYEKALAEAERKREAKDKKVFKCEWLNLGDAKLDDQLKQLVGKPIWTKAATDQDAERILKKHHCQYQIERVVSAPGAAESFVKGAKADHKSDEISLTIARPPGQDFWFVLREDRTGLGWTISRSRTTGSSRWRRTTSTSFTVQVGLVRTGQFVPGARVWFTNAGEDYVGTTNENGEVTFRAKIREAGRVALTAQFDGQNGVKAEGWRDMTAVDRDREDVHTATGRVLRYDRPSKRYVGDAADHAGKRKLGLVPGLWGTGLAGTATQIARLVPVEVVTYNPADPTQQLVGRHNAVELGSTNSLVAATAGFIATNGGTFVGSNGNTFISTNGGTVIAPGGGNVIAPGGGNFGTPVARQSIVHILVPVAMAVTVYAIYRAMEDGRVPNAGKMTTPEAKAAIRNTETTLREVGVEAPTGEVLPQGVGVIAVGGGNVIAPGGGNVIAPGGGNVIAPGGGNVIAPGGGNLLGQAGGNVIAPGGGNVIAPGGGNAVSQPTLRVIAPGGGNVIAPGGGNLLGQAGGNVIAPEAAT